MGMGLPAFRLLTSWKPSLSTAKKAMTSPGSPTAFTEPPVDSLGHLDLTCPASPQPQQGRLLGSTGA